MAASRFSVVVVVVVAVAVVLGACGEGPAAEVRSRPGALSASTSAVDTTRAAPTTPSSTNPGVVITTTPTLPPVDPSTLGAECAESGGGAVITAVGVEGTFDITLEGTDCAQPLTYDTFLTIYRTREVNCPAVRYVASRMEAGSKEAGYAAMAAEGAGCVDDTAQIDFELAGWEYNRSLCTIFGTQGDDVIEGTSGNDTICSGAGDDTVTGLDGNDAIRVGKGNNMVDAGPGNDTVDVDQGEVEEAAGDNIIFGGPGIDRVDGGPGADVIDLGEGGDNGDGAGGDDILIGGPGRDFLDGGDGNDILVGADSARNPAGFGDNVDGEEGVDLALMIDGNAGEFYPVRRDVEAEAEFCVFEEELADDGSGVLSGTLRCPLIEDPIPMAVDGSDVTYESPFLERLLTPDLDQLRTLAAMLSDTDICICEPPVYSSGVSTRKIVGDNPADPTFP